MIPRPARLIDMANPPPPPTTALFPDAANRLRWDHELTLRLDAAAQAVAAGPVTACADPEQFEAQLASFDFQRPVAFDDLLGWTIGSLQTGLVQVTHPRYLGLFNPAPSFAAQCADRISATFNPQLASATTSPAAVAIEAHVIRALAKRAGLGPQAGGHFCSGGSEANFTAVVCALTRAEPGFAARGARAFAGQPVFYISADSHLAWIKIAHQAGIGRDAARLIATDGAGRMDMAALARAIIADRACGHVPFMVAATAGTTNAGLIDPLPASAGIARAAKLWFHVDAAWGGGLLAAPRYQPLLHGIEQADSITVDAHKWFATTMGCGMFITAHPQVLTAACNVAASFMPSHAPASDPYTSTLQWSRRFAGLRLFMSLAAAGWEGHAAHVEQAFARTDHLSEILKLRGWTLVNPGALAVACLAPPAGAPPVREIVRRVLEGGEAWVSAAMFEGTEVIRACVTNGQTSAADIEIVAQALERAAR